LPLVDKKLLWRFLISKSDSAERLSNFEMMFSKFSNRLLYVFKYSRIRGISILSWFSSLGVVPDWIFLWRRVLLLINGEEILDEV
jgi:hypothetical protein